MHGISRLGRIGLDEIGLDWIGLDWILQCASKLVLALVQGLSLVPRVELGTASRTSTYTTYSKTSLETTSAKVLCTDGQFLSELATAAALLAY